MTQKRAIVAEFFIFRVCAFEGDNVSTTLAAVLKDDVNWGVLPADVPLTVGALLHRCLERDPRRRLRDIGDARVPIEDVLSGAVSDRIGAPPAPATPVSRRRERVWMTVAALTFALAGSLVLWPYLTPAPIPERVEFFISPPEGQFFPFGFGDLSVAGILAVSPDGRHIAFVAGDRLWIRALDSATAQPLAGTEGARQPVWSPDGRFLAFESGGKTRRIAG